MDNQEQQHQIIPPTQSEPKPKSPKDGPFYSKLLGYGFLAAILILVVAGVYAWQYGGSNTPEPTPQSYATPQADPDPTADWKTYRNEEFGFEVKYPANFRLTDSVRPTSMTVSLESEDFLLTFFAGTEARGGYIGQGTVWEKEILIDGRSVNEALVRCDENSVTLQIARTLYVPGLRFDQFNSDCFDESLADSFIPQIEEIAKTLKYDQSSQATPEAPQLQAEILTTGEFIGIMHDLKLTSLSREPIVLDKVIDPPGGWSGTVSILKNGTFTGESFPCTTVVNVTSCDFGTGYLISPNSSITLQASKEGGFNTELALPEVTAHGQNSGLNVELIYK